MRRREFITVLAGTVTGWPFFAQAASRIYRVGLLSSGQPLTANNDFGAAILRGLATHGYTPDRNLALEIRGAEAHPERLPLLADELVASKPDVILTLSYPAAIAAKHATTIIPIVATESGGDPVATGLVDSLSRPNGNVTGVSDMAIELSAKRLELLKDIVPALRTVAMLWNASDLGMTLRYQGAATAAQILGVKVQPLGVREPEDFDQAFAAMTRDPPDAILMVSDALTALNRLRIYEFAAAHRLPATYERENFVREGGLTSYGPDLNEIYDRAADLIDRLLKGAKPADLPFEQPTRFRLGINLKTAKELGLIVPASVIARADQVFE
jgi:putative tryptophan/tyrosine transport system substrate-binding protein